MSSRLSRRNFLKLSAAAAAGAASLGAVDVQAAPSLDLVITGATVIDGTGAPPWKADIGIAGDEIAAIGSIDPARAARRIEANGLHLCPGFIDIHSHSDALITVYRTGDSKVRQGVTTELTGNCGGSAAPLVGIDADKRREMMKQEDDIIADWSDTASYFERLDNTEMSVNIALLLGQGTLRQNRVGLVDRPLTPGELADVVRAVDEGMDQGAVGLSTGLEYIPGSYTPPEEILEMARAVARNNGLYATHMRDEGATVLGAVNEAVELGRGAGVLVEISHLKAAGKPNWDKMEAVLTLIEGARAGGVDIMADAYPYPVYSTSLTIYIPAWALEGGDEALVARIGDKATRARIAAELDSQIYNDPGDYSLIYITRLKTDKNKPLIGRNVAEIAEFWNMEPADAALRLLVEEASRVQMVGHGMKPENVEMVLSHPLVMIGSDGYSMAPTGKRADSRPHPRSYGTYPRVLGYYCRERGIFDLPTAVRKCTSTPADRIGIRDRGRIARGMKADLVLFDAGRVIDTATFQDPHQYPEGIEHVLVNGVQVIRNGNHTGATPGRTIRRT